MTATGHALIGLALAAKIPNPYIGIPLAIISHIAADAFPHWDTGTNMKKKSKKTFVIQSLLDLTFSFTLPFLLLSLFYSWTNPFYAFIMIIAAQGFDWASAPVLFLGWKFPPFTWFQTMQRLFDDKLDKPWGIIGQIIVVTILLVIAAL